MGMPGSRCFTSLCSSLGHGLKGQAGRESSLLGCEDPPDLVTVLQLHPVPLHLSSLPALLVMAHGN